MPCLGYSGEMAKMLYSAHEWQKSEALQESFADVIGG
jgi:hypothetical protein